MKYSAKVQADSSINYNGNVGSIHKISALILNKDSSNGWSFWYIKRNDKLISIDDLRYDYEQKFYKKQSNYCVEIPFETDAIHDIKIIFCMTMMNYNKFKQILNETIFENLKLIY